MFMANINEVKAKLSEYLDRASRGEHIVICRHNKPLAELRPVEAVRTQPRPIGPLPGRPAFEVAASFFEPMADDELALWEGVPSTDPVSPAWTPPPPQGASKVAEKKGAYRKPRGGHSGRRRP
jgi:prevent-host-death family protein